MHHNPAAFDRALHSGRILIGRALDLEQERAVYLLNVNAAVLNGLDAVGDLDQLAGGRLRVGQ